jgi:DNA mismatch repair protein MutL
MGKIHLLHPDEIKKIAAGEVVERPVNIVKELVENSLDAGATKIEIILEDAGKKLVRIIDNGCGMSEKDARLCFEQHATSKISGVADLQSVATFGFRGEALSSIAAVSRVEMITRENGSPHGYKFVREYGVEISSEISSASQGTDVSIHEIFSNIPARKKFLKTTSTELNQIIQFFHALCLSHLNVHCLLHHEGRMIYNCPVVDSLSKRFTQIWDNQVASSMLALAEYNSEGLHVSGFSSNHNYARYGRNQLFLFVNKRWIKNPKLTSALLRGYSGVLPPGKYPAAVITINIDSSMIDVNIHPRKEEVQFVRSKQVEDKIAAMVKARLEQNVSQQLNRPVQFVPAARVAQQDAFSGSILQSTEDSRYIPSLRYDPPTDNFAFDEQPVSAWEEVAHEQEMRLFEDVSGVGSFGLEQQIAPQVVVPCENQDVIEQREKSLAEDVRVIGQLFKTYILVERDGAFIMIDQHAAHERILYELFSQRFEDVATVDLLFPLTVSLSKRSLDLLLPYMSVLKDVGIVLESFGQAQLIVTATPVIAKNIDFADLLQQVVVWIEETEALDSGDLAKKITEKVHAQMACKAAIKAGDVLDVQQINQLLVDLEKTDNRLTCPHGRPTMWVVSRNEIEVKFKRKR